MMINNLNSLQTRTNVAGILTRSYVLLAEAASLLEQPSDPVADHQAKEQLTTAIRWQISALVNLLHYNTKTTPSAAIQQMRQAHTQLHSAVETLERRSQQASCGSSHCQCILPNAKLPQLTLSQFMKYRTADGGMQSTVQRRIPSV